MHQRSRFGGNVPSINNLALRGRNGGNGWFSIFCICLLYGKAAAGASAFCKNAFFCVFY